MRRALCPEAKRKNFFAEFELRTLRPEEDPAVYKWELENILSKADPSLSNDAKSALLTRQFSKGLPPTLKLKMLEHNPTPTLAQIVKFTQRFRALSQPTAETARVHIDAVTRPPPPPDPQLKEILTMVAGIAEKQQALENRLNRTEPSANSSTRSSFTGTCYSCGFPGHFSRDCTRQRPFSGRRTMICYWCGKPGHIARECRSSRHLNYYGMDGKSVEIVPILY
ncbi:uncharacterized protein LOC114544598 [Dendronephthya gigantea]|uniref:uncharacterized protein LOC114544598 n=1 Tax=Dendronephthya gigantea TaxID=151771 RepID=UPI00106BE95E|nr:uncharacterized protein LOC114544598 [Dendronephthya gigantea]